MSWCEENPLPIHILAPIMHRYGTLAGRGEGYNVSEFQPSGVPVVPNASRVRGRLVRIKREPGARGSVWEITVDEARDVEGLPNFAQAHVGKIIQVYVHQELHHDLAERDSLEARIAFRGDERGGRFVLIEDDVRKL